MRSIVQALYATYAYTESDMLSYRIERANPYPAKTGEHEGVILCGHNPYLFARLVDQLACSVNGNVTWKERPRLKLRRP